MIRAVAGLASLALMVVPSFAQNTAAVNSGAALPDATEVVSQCGIVAASDDGPGAVTGICIGSAQQYLTGIVGLEPAPKDEAIRELVTELVPLVQDGVCDAADEEVAQAIRLLAEGASADLNPALLDIAVAVVEDCATTGTAAIPGADAASPA